MQKNADDELNIKKIRTLASEELKLDLSLRKDWFRDQVHELIRLHFNEEVDDDETELSPQTETIVADDKPRNGISQLTISSKLVQRTSSIIVQLDDGIEFANDTGVIGRISMHKRKLTFDLKGHQYDAQILPCSTLLVLDTKGDQSKIEMICDEYIELSGKRSVMLQMSGKLIRGNISHNAHARDEGDNFDAGTLLFVHNFLCRIQFLKFRRWLKIVKVA